MRVVLRIGGSVVASPVNADLIVEYADLLRVLRKQGNELVVVVGGGTLARELIAVAKNVGLDEQSQDRIAISVSRILAQFFSEKLGKVACGTLPLTLDEVVTWLVRKKVVVMGGLKPGMTTDTVAALVANEIEADVLIKATDQDGVYNKDPKNHSDAVKLDHLSFEDLSRVFSESKHKAGIHQVIDPKAVIILKSHRIKVIVVNGFKPENVLLALKGKPVGTLID